MDRKYYRVISVASGRQLGVCSPKVGEKPEDCNFDADYYGFKVYFEEIAEEEFNLHWE